MAPKRTRDGAEDSDDDFKPDVDSDEDSKSPKKGGKGGKKAKQEGGGGGGPKARKGWGNDELLDMWQQVGKLALANMATIKAGMTGKRDSASLNHKLRAELKRKDQELGGDGKWVDNFKLGPSPSKKGKA